MLQVSQLCRSGDHLDTLASPLSSPRRGPLNSWNIELFSLMDILRIDDQVIGVSKVEASGHPDPRFEHSRICLLERSNDVQRHEPVNDPAPCTVRVVALEEGNCIQDG